jgi:uncharacterized membrane protein
MNKTLAEIMKSGKEALQERWGLAIGTFLVYEIIIGAFQRTTEDHSYTSLLLLAVAGPLSLGVSVFSLNIARNREARFEQIFEGFRNYTTSLVAYLLVALFVLLWSLLLIIPGIIAALSYSMTFFVIADNESIEPMEALNRSKQMMEGYKLKLFYLSLRFFGLALLCILTLGIGFLWLIPYTHVTTAKFYDDIKDHPAVKEF